MTELVTFDGFATEGSDLSPFAGHDKLERIMVSGEFSDLTPLENLPSPFNLTLYNRISAPLPDFSKCPNFHTLSLYGAEDISELRGCKNIATLSLIDSPLTDISAVADMPNLTALMLSDTGVTDISPVTALELTAFRYEGDNIDEVRFEQYKAQHPDCLYEW